MARTPVQEVVGTLVGRLRYPWVVAILGILFVADMVIPDPIPFVDEVMLALLTFLVGSWRARKADQRPIDVTPGSEGEQAPPDQP
jgi:hypothetical protein